MITVPVDRDFAEQLSKIDDVAEFRDADGRVLGSFTPARFTREPGEPLPPALSDEEIVRRLAERPLLTTAEVLASLRSAG